MTDPSRRRQQRGGDQAARTYLITGAASGIGRATARRLGARGHRVIGADLKDTDISADLGTAEGRALLAEAAADLGGGRLDAVIACAGVAAYDPVTVRVNAFGAIATLTGLRPLLAAGRDPRAAAVASVAVLHPADPAIVEAVLADDEAAAVAAARAAVERGEGQRVYASAKHALARWVRRAAVSDAWAGAGIPLNAIGPGIIRTPMSRPMLEDPEVRAIADAAVPMPLHGYGEPEQVAPLLDFLTSPENTHVTGQVVFIDGGADAVLRGDASW
ncbi:3-alpha-hydroxysteroid dehydrogenase/carbonyl reductase [Streptomyces sp. YIM 121038]|uniref:SDR family oxidoreductase n=1 Tax=Streptomyces sp. YIM 121038 TaxID=2136401 RepID=UPI001110AC67|nr:SDR family oxidoreductase [Streptomyces sp. YIM 121038]QCX76297.1 3-alpha-hydroxysteroid dehydrogenase/carbonyl reductase [Streptomyces sp. YIM 121038]